MFLYLSLFRLVAEGFPSDTEEEGEFEECFPRRGEKENFKKRHIEKGAELIGNVHSKDMEGLVLIGKSDRIWPY